MSSPASGTATVNPDGSITFTPAAVGSASFQYTVQDSHAATSNAATVSITVQAADTLNTVRAQFRTRGDWRVTGTATIPGPGNTITLHIGPTLAGPVLGTVAVDATGGWDFVLKGSSIRPDSTNTLSVGVDEGRTISRCATSTAERRHFSVLSQGQREQRNLGHKIRRQLVILAFRHLSVRKTLRAALESQQPTQLFAAYRAGCYARAGTNPSHTRQSKKRKDPGH